MSFKFTTVLNEEAKKWGVQIAYVISQMDSLSRSGKTKRTDGGVMYLFALAQEHGVCESIQQFRRLIKKMVELGLITIAKKRHGATNVNLYYLTELVTQSQERLSHNKDKASRTNSLSGTDVTKKSQKAAEIRKSQTPFQNTPDMKAPESPAYTPEAPTSPVQAVMKREVIAEGIYSTTDNGSSVYVVSNGRDVPKMIDARFKSLLETTCQELGVSPDVSIVKC